MKVLVPGSLNKKKHRCRRMAAILRLHSHNTINMATHVIQTAAQAVIGPHLCPRDSVALDATSLLFHILVHTLPINPARRCVVACRLIAASRRADNYVQQHDVQKPAHQILHCTRQRLYRIPASSPSKSTTFLSSPCASLSFCSS